MKTLLKKINNVYPSVDVFDWVMLFFRIAISLQIMVVHGLKKLGIGVAEVEQVPNPLHLPVAINQLFATAANLVFPVLVAIGLFTRLAVLPTLAITLTGYFVVHWSDSLPAKDVPFMYSIAFLLVLVLGPGKYSLDNNINKKLRS